MKGNGNAFLRNGKRILRKLVLSQSSAKFSSNFFCIGWVIRFGKNEFGSKTFLNIVIDIYT